MENRIRYGSDGWYVEWTRQDGCIAHWFGTLEECKQRSEYPPEDCWWVVPDDIKVRLFDL